MPDGSLIIAVGDLKGHGSGSALVMALTRVRSKAQDRHWAFSQKALFRSNLQSN
jgi:serine phosphatase RsbU (regulator of sigma subunit)